jgi:hypothetical protein
LYTGGVSRIDGRSPNSPSSNIGQRHSAVSNYAPQLPGFPRIDMRQEPLGNCKPRQIYSADDIVGGPEACIKESFNGLGNRGLIATVSVPALQQASRKQILLSPAVNSASYEHFHGDHRAAGAFGRLGRRLSLPRRYLRTSHLNDAA